MEFGFEKLEVYQLAIEFTDKVFSVSSAFSLKVQSSLGDQFRRAAISIPNNIAEGSAKVSSREKRQFYNYALNSTNECVPIITIAKNQNELTGPEHDYMRKTCGRIYMMLVKLIKSTDMQKTDNE